MRGIPDMWKETYDLVAQVPKGRVTTYGEVARALGDVVASRFVGLAMSLNDDIVRVPCRRVVQSDGFVGGYTGGGPRKKARLLRSEGVSVEGDRVVGLEHVMFTEFKTGYPLRALRRRQRTLRRHLRVENSLKKIDSIAGVDVAYEGDLAFAAMVTFDFRTGERLDTRMVRSEAKFPYIPTYLAFREIPIIRPLLRDLGPRTAIMYDGNGTLHPEGFGIASQVGVTFDIPTIGVAKKLLCGEPVNTESERMSRIKCEGRTAGYAVKGPHGEKPIYVSPGHMVSQGQARDAVIRFMKHRIPEPTRAAHMAAETARRTNHK